jgi:hypothetical protein
MVISITSWKMSTTKTKFPTTRVVLSGVLLRRDVSWRRIGSVNRRYEWVAQTLEVTMVDPNSWMDDWDFGRDGLHLNRREARHLGKFYSRVCSFGGGRQKKNEWQRPVVGTSSKVTCGETGMTQSTNIWRGPGGRLRVIRWWQIRRGWRHINI